MIRACSLCVLETHQGGRFFGSRMEWPIHSLGCPTSFLKSTDCDGSGNEPLSFGASSAKTNRFGISPKGLLQKRPDQIRAHRNPSHHALFLASDYSEIH